MKELQVRILNEEHFVEVQEALFELGYEWVSSGKRLITYSKQLYLVSTDRLGKITHGGDYNDKLPIVNLEELKQELTSKDNSLVNRIKKCKEELAKLEKEFKDNRPMELEIGYGITVGLTESCTAIAFSSGIDSVHVNVNELTKLINKLQEIKEYVAE